MRGIIVYKNRDNGIKQFNALKEQYENHRIKCTRCVMNKHSSWFMEFENGDYWTLVGGNPLGFRGRRANIVYVERSIDEEIFYSCIMPLLTFGPYQGIRLYGEGNLCIQNYREDK